MSKELQELEELEEYRGYNYNSNSRTKKQIHLDFLDCCSLLEEGRTWAEISVIINEIRDYDISLEALKMSYKNRIERLALKKSPEFERDRIIEDLDAVMLKMIMQYNESLEDKIEVKEKYERKSALAENEDDSDNPKIINVEVLTERVIKKAKSLGDTKFIEMYLKAQERKIQLMGLAPKETKTYDLNIFLKQNPIDDTQGNKQTAIQSEEQAKRFGESI